MANLEFGPPILIAGAGIAGLALGLALADRGIASRILERRGGLSEAGAGIQLGPNGVKAMQALGIGTALMPFAGRPEAIVVRDGGTGRVLQSLPLGDWIEARHGAPYLVAHRQDLHGALLERARRGRLISIETGFDVAHFEDRSVGEIMVTSTDGCRHVASALIGADGIHSTLRRQLFPTQRPRFTGRTASRTTMQIEALPRGTFRDAVAATETGVWLAPDAHVVHYPVRGGSEIAFVIIGTEPWQQESWSVPVSWTHVLRNLRSFSPHLKGLLEGASEWRRWALLDADPLPAWSAGRVGLIGDAAHPVLPFLAQGGCLALEDALVLAAEMAACPNDMAAALHRFDAVRIGRATRVLHASRRNGRIFHLRGVSAHARNTVLGLLPPARVMQGYDWLYGWAPPDLPHSGGART